MTDHGYPHTGYGVVTSGWYEITGQSLKTTAKTVRVHSIEKEAAE